MIEDFFVIFLYHIKSAIEKEINESAQLGAMICSYAVVVILVYAVITIIILQYKMQTEKILDMSRELEMAANQDSLTKLYNRRYLTDRLQQWMSLPGKEFWVALIDIDDFKHINDTYGHMYGDKVLIEFSKYMTEEIGADGIAARFGGEEFMLIFEDANMDIAMDTLERIRCRLLEFSRDNKTLITFSCGLTKYCKEQKITQLFNEADEKLYVAKRSGKNQIVFEIRKEDEING